MYADEARQQQEQFLPQQKQQQRWAWGEARRLPQQEPGGEEEVPLAQRSRVRKPHASARQDAAGHYTGACAKSTKRKKPVHL